MKKYLTTIDELKEVSVASLGPMKKGQYEDFMRRAKNTELDNPRLVIHTILTKTSMYGVKEVVYAIADFEWDDFSEDPLASYTPEVHVVDGNLYTTGI